MGQALVCGLCIVNCCKFDESSSEELSFPLLVCSLHLFDQGNEPLELTPCEIHSVYFLSDDRLQAVDRALLGLEVAGRDGSVFGISHDCLVRVRSLTLLGRLLVCLQFVGIGSLDELGLGSLKLGVRTVTFLDQILELLAVGSEPDAADGGTQHIPELGLAHVVFRD